MKNFLLKIITFIKRRGLLVLSSFLFCLLILSIIFLVNLNSNTKEILIQSTNQQNEILLLKQKEENNSDTIKSMQDKLDDLIKSENEYMLINTALQQTLDEKQMLLDRKSIIEKIDIQTYKDEDIFEKIVYMTFDDGPSMQTERILKILDEYNIKATFFVNYNVYADENNLYKKIVDSGHVLGNHTYSHTLAANNWTDFYESLFKMEDYLFEKTGIRPNIIRFPGGSKYEWRYSEENSKKALELENMGYVFFDWNVSNYDASSDITFNDSEDMASYVISQSRGRDKIILLMHDRSKKYMTVNSLDKIISFYKDEGYVFLPLTENSVDMQFFSISN